MSLLPPSLSLPDNVTPAPFPWGVTSLLRLRGVIPRFSARLGWTLYTAVSGLFFLLLTFPTDVLLQRVITGATRGLPVRIHYTQGELTWRGGCRLREVEVTYGTAPTVRMTRVTLRPSLLGLIVGRPWPLGFTADLYGGTLSGNVTADASGQRIGVTARRLDLRLLPMPGMDKGGEVRGILSGEGEMRGQFADLLSLQGQVALTVTDGALRAGMVSGFTLPPISSVEAQLRGAVKKGLVDITDFTLRADNAEARLRGTLTLGAPLPMSALNLQINAKALGTTSPPLTLLLSLLPPSPEVPGERRASIRGSLAAPVLQ